MRALVISTDKKFLEKGSAVLERHIAYSREFDAFDVLVLGGKGEQSEGGLMVSGVGSRFPILRGIAALFKALRLTRPDVISVQDPFENGLIALFLSWWRKVPLHVQVHTDFSRKEFVRHSLTNRIRRIFARFVLSRASRIRVVSEGIRDSLQATGYPSTTTLRVGYGAGKLPSISVLPIFVDIEKYRGLSRTKHDRFKIALLWVGRLEEEKNPLVAIQLLEIARKNGHDAGLIVVGSGSMDSKLHAYVRTRGLERYVEFAGWQENLAPYFSVADIMLVTSAYEGYGMAMIEALAAGVPVLSLDVGVARESGAIVVGRPKEMGRALLDWIAHGPRKGELQNYPYGSFDEYVNAWCEDVRATES